MEKLNSPEPKKQFKSPARMLPSNGPSSKAKGSVDSMGGSGAKIRGPGARMDGGKSMGYGKH